MSDLRINELIQTRNMLASALASTHNGKRDLYSIFGYNENPTIRDYRHKYNRDHIASRIVRAYPEAVWSRPPEIVENEDTQDSTTFEAAFETISKKLDLWHYILRADILSQLGRYSVLFVGVSDGQEDLTQPVGRGEPIFLMPFGEDNAEIDTYELDVTNERYGRPKQYRLTTTNVDGQGQQTLTVHHSRCIHIAERLLDNDIYGKPFLESIVNRIDDIEKVVGGSAETYWLNSRGGLSIEADKDVEVKDPEKIRQQIDEYVHQLSRVIRTKGMSVNPLNHAVHSPKDAVDVILMLISGATGIPKRILSGSEQAKLASSQDDKNWWDRVDERRKNFCRPAILDKFIKLCMQVGALEMKEEWDWNWPELNQLSTADQAEVAVKRAQAIATYANSPESDHVIPPEQFVEDILHMEYREEEIDEILEEENEEIDRQLAIDKQLAKEKEEKPPQQTQEE